jgi:20S proteasome alpha/beta subunit
MTLIVAMKYEGGAVVSSDSRVTYSPEEPLMREEAQKIETLGKFALTGVGLAGPCDRIIKEIKTTFRSSPPPSFDNLVEICENIMWAFYQKYAERIQEEEEEEDWSLLLMSQDRICRIMVSGWAEEETMYATEGTGDLYAEYILKQRYKPNMSEREAKVLGTYIISQTSRIDPNVGGKICLTLIDKHGLKRVSDEELGKILESITEPAFFETEKEIQKVVHEIVEKRRWINTAFKHKFGFELFEQNEFAISEIQKGCRNETDFTSRISALALLIDEIGASRLDKQLSTHLTGSVNILETFLKEKYQDFNMNLIVNLRDIMTLRSKKMPIHEDDPKIIQVVLKWEHKIPPDWPSLWKQALMRYKESLLELEKLLSS